MSLHPDLVKLARECEITAYKSSGPGGQKKNKTESSVRVVHRATGLTRIGTESRSQLRNKEAALQRLWDALEKRRRKPKPRKATKPTRGSVERRLEEKRRQSARQRSGGDALDE
ncbi:MAG: peptide chain release factor-like protein [Candidatus Eisenbacteria bacterium]